MNSGRGIGLLFRREGDTLNSGQSNRPLIQERRRYLEFRQRNRGLSFRREGETLNSDRGKGLLIQERRRDLKFRQRNVRETLNSGRGTEASCSEETEIP